MKTQIYTNTRFLSALCGVLFLSCLSCDSFTDVDNPNSQLTSASVFESASTANAAVADIYAQLRENGLLSGKTFGLSNVLGIYSDEMISYDASSNPSSEFYNNSVLPSNAVILTLWNAAYNQIYAANSIIARLRDATALKEAEKNQFQGEALFMRALNHFYLTNLFGDVPYVTGTDYSTNNMLTRTPHADVMSGVVADLESGIALLPADYPTMDRARVNKSVAKALLARVYLYKGDWAAASNMASAVINENTIYALEPDLNNTFLRNSTSTIWQLASAYEGHNTDEAAIFVLEAGPPSSVALTDNLVQAFEPGDLRKQNWTASVSDGTTSWDYAFKYKQKNDTGASVEFSIILRLAEQYLIRAEARARQGELIGAKDDLNVIRHNAGLPDTMAISQVEILDAVLQERRVELFTEQGHRFFDLKRFGRLNDLTATKPGWSATDALFPLPQEELLRNLFLGAQNPGY